MEICMRRRQRGLQFYRKKKGLSMQAVKEVFSWIVLSVLAVFLAFMVIWAVGLRTNMIGVSMEPGLTNGQGILVNRLKYRFFSPQTGDVVVFLPNGNQKNLNLLSGIFLIFYKDFTDSSCFRAHSIASASETPPDCRVFPCWPDGKTDSPDCSRCRCPSSTDAPLKSLRQAKLLHWRATGPADIFH